MYCSSCGTSVAPGLNYCKRCGVKLNEAKNEDSTMGAEPESESLIWAKVSLVWAIVTVFITGLGATIGLMAVMKTVLDFNPGLITAITLLCFLLIFVIEGGFIWLLLNRKRSVKEFADISRLKGQVRKELGEQQMQGHLDPQSSVSEPTTHTLEPIYNEPKSKL
jgi:uncharacterized paraquat-inducible protein A